jgi:hypothetical protein
MNTAPKTSLRLTASALALAAGLAISAISGAAVAQPVSDVYAYAGTQPATGVAYQRIEVAHAPVTGRVAALEQIQAGQAAFGLGTERPIVVAAPFVGRGYTPSASGGVIGLAAGR